MTIAKYTFYFYCLLLPMIFWCSSCYSQKPESGENFNQRVIVHGLEDPWNIIYGPDDHLWVTESKTYKVLRLNPENGETETLADLSTERDFHRDGENNEPWPQGGLMGMALHPEFLQGKPYVYLALVHEFIGDYGKDAPLEDQGTYFKTKLMRFSYEPENGNLTEPMTIIDTIPGSNDHNGGRLCIANVEGKDYLFYSVGDMGAGQFHNAARQNHAQDKDIYEGKILRFHLEPDTDKEGVQSWIPDDNPFRNAVWSFGHRNPQGLAPLAIDGKHILYSSEHGPYSDDEINIIIKGGNYGHPLVVGYTDGNYDGLSAAVTDREELPGPWNTSLPLIESEKENAEKLQDYQEPLYSFYPKDNEFLTDLAEKEKAGKSAQWDAVAHSGITVYSSDAIPGWQNSLLVTSLVKGSMYRLKLNQSGDRVTDCQKYFTGRVRYRDVAVSSDGLKIYIITDKSLITSGPSGEDPQVTDLRGAIIEYKWKGN